MMDQRSSGFLGGIPVVTKNIIIVNLLMWLATFVFARAGINLVNLLGLHFPGATDFYAYQLITYMFMHDTSSFTHIFFNMFAVYMFGRILENVWGSNRFLCFYLVAGIGAALMQELVWFFQLKDVIGVAEGMTINWVGVGVFEKADLLNHFVTIGASGSVFGILLAFGMMFPNVPLYLMFIPIPIKAKYFVIFYGLIELFLGVSNFGGDNVAHFAHLGGMLFGFFMIIYWRKKDKNNGRGYY